MTDNIDFSTNTLEGKSFEEPWAARLFGMTLALSETQAFTLQEFQAAMIETVADFESWNCIEDERVYYTRWLEALQSVLRTKGIIMPGRLSETEETVVKRLLDLQHERMHHHHGGAIDPERIKPTVVA